MRGVEECYHGSQVRVFRLNRQEVLSRLRLSAERLLAERSDVLAVWLFGSLARNDAAPGSDADLLIAVRDGAGPFLDRPVSLTGYFTGAGVGCDVIAYTESEVERLRQDSTSFVGTALAEGTCLARR